MATTNSRPSSVDAYIAGFDGEVQEVLQGVRQALHRGVPGAGERISYAMPTLTLDGRSLVHFAAWDTTSASTRCPSRTRH